MSRIYVAAFTAVVLISALMFYPPYNRVAGQVAVQVRPTYLDIVEATPSGTHVNIRADSPMAVLASHLSEEYGVAVNYEEAVNRLPALLEDRRPPAIRFAHPESPFLQRKWAHWEAELKSPLVSGSFSGMVQLLEEAVTSYNASDPPEQFRVLVEGHPERVSLVAINVNDEGGVRRPVTPLLDQKVALPSTRQTVDEAFLAIAEQLTADTGMKVVIGDTPRNLTNRLWYTPRPQVQSARLALEEINAISPLELAWEAVYDEWKDRWILRIGSVQRHDPEPGWPDAMSAVKHTPGKKIGPN